jgi:large subunit ribosomal protein L5
MVRLKEKYQNETVPALMSEFSYGNIMQVPKLEKIVINMRFGDCKDNPKQMEAAAAELGRITGQRPIILQAKKSVSNFKLRKGMTIGAKVTLRSDKMYEFVDKLFNVALPRVRDFRGTNANSFDGRGNYTMGVKEQLIFPEINYDEIEKLRGMDIIFVTTAKTDKESYELLKLLGMPFSK